MKRLVLVLAFLVVLLSATTVAQTIRGSLSGLVSDASGAALSGAKVIATHVGSGEEFRATTDSQGAFVFPSVPLGQYNAKVEAANFKRTEVQAITVSVGVQATFNVALEIGDVSESVVVTSDSQAVINTSTPTLTNVVDTRQVKDLPLPTRNPIRPGPFANGCCSHRH